MGRGEWVITYDVEDAAGNAAEKVQFALILVDTDAPSFTNSPQTTSGTTDYCRNAAECDWGNDGPIRLDGSGTVDIELCGLNNIDTWDLRWTRTAITSTDTYDGALTEDNSQLQHTITAASPNQGDYSIPHGDYYGMSCGGSHPSECGLRYTGARSVEYYSGNQGVSKTYDYTLTSADYADIFGVDNQNNVVTETGTIRLRDTIQPTIILPNTGSWECGYVVPQDRYRPNLQYQDCYDDGAWKIQATRERVQVTVGASCPVGQRCVAHANKIDVDTYLDQMVSTHKTLARQITFYYNVKDRHNIPADEATRTFNIVDTIAPTLYITKKQWHHNAVWDHGRHGTNNCLHHTAESSNSNMDKTSEYCTFEQEHNDDGTGHKTWEHKTTTNNGFGDNTVGSNLPGNPLQSEVEIQHSAGYATDYQFVQELMQEGTGYSCFDVCTETTTTVEWKVSCDGSDGATEFNMLIPGTYYLKYSCVDGKDENQVQRETTACRTFINLDKTRPVITVLEASNTNNGVWNIEASRDNNYVDAGATCSDMVDGNISQDVEVSGDVVNMAAVGTYLINYNCEDSAGQKALTATRTVVVEDNICPTCVVPGTTETITVEASFPYTEEEATCTDKNGNGKNIAQNNGCRAQHYTKTVVVEDTMVPIISLKYKGTKLGRWGYMAESTTTTVNGWVIGAVASAVSGVALLGYAATRKTAVATSVPV